MRRLGLGLFALQILGLAACVADPRDPNTWIKKLSDPRESKDAIMQLRRIGDPAAVPPLLELYKKTKDAEVLRAIATFKDKRSLPVLVDALDFSEDSCEGAASAATALGDIGDPSAAEALSKVLAKPLPIKTRCNVIKLESIKALVKLKTGADALVKTLTTPADEQDFFLNSEAAKALGELADPKGVPALVRGLFMTGRGSDIYQPCRVALMRIGAPAVQPLIEAFQRKNEALEADAKKYEFRPGVVEQKTALVLGDLRAKEAAPAMLAMLKKPKLGDAQLGALYALGMIADPATSKDVIAVLNSAATDYTIRKSAADALNFIGDPSSLPALLAAAKTADVVKGGEKYADVRIASALAYSRLGGAAEAAAFAPVADAEKAAETEFGECETRLELAKKCDKDVACYGAGLDDAVLAKQEKAAFMLGRLGKPALPFLLKKINHQEPVVRLAVLHSIGRVADKGAADVIKALEAQIELDRTKPPPIRDLVNEMRALKAYLESK